MFFQVIHAVEGEPLTLTCNFRANPAKGAHIKWYRNGHSIELPPHPTAAQGKEADNSLRIEAARSTAGLYACSVENEVGRSDSTDIAHVFVEEKPQVTLHFEPRQPVSELMDANVTLMCSSNYNCNEVMEHAPNCHSFIAVKWYLDGDLLKQARNSCDCTSRSN